MSTLTRYTLLQIPGWLGAAAVLGVCWDLQLISVQSAGGLFALWFLKDAVAYPFVRKAYERSDGTRAEDLIGTRGVVQRELAPGGFVRIRGELWRAEVGSGASILPAGADVVVREARGLILIVEGCEQNVDASTGRRRDRRR